MGIDIVEADGETSAVLADVSVGVAVSGVLAPLLLEKNFMIEVMNRRSQCQAM